MRIKRDYPLTVCIGLFCLLITVLFGCGEPQEKAYMLDVKYESTLKISQKKDSISANEKANILDVKHESTFKTSQMKDSISANEQVILCFGNSLTEGYGLKEEEAYPAILQQKIDSAGFNYKVVNAGLSGETTSGGLGRLNWVLQSQKNIQLFILELGTNDGLRGISLKEAKKNLQQIIDTVSLKIPKAPIVLAGMQIPPNMGPEYTTKFKNIFPALAESNSIALIPFLLEGVAGDKTLNQEDGIHPTAEGTKIVAKNVWKIIQPFLK